MAEAAPFVAGFTMIGVVQGLTGPLTTLLNVVGHVKVQSKIIWLEFVAFVLLAVALTPEYKLIGSSPRASSAACCTHSW